jgi:hypothetical protein
MAKSLFYDFASVVVAKKIAVSRTAPPKRQQPSEVAFAVNFRWKKVTAGAGELAKTTELPPILSSPSARMAIRFRESGGK